MKSFRVNVPGNLLLAGEYAVLEPEGLGVAIGVEPRLTATVSPASEFTLVGVFPGSREVWKPERGTGTFGFLAKLFQTLEKTTDGSERLRLPEVQIEIDSTAFFDAAGRKRGFGSSAAAAAALAAAWHRLNERFDLPVTAQAAVEAHRFAQNGRGSGYDVAASSHGGLGLFTGGLVPSWTQGSFDDLPYAVFFPGPAEVKTVSSILSYTVWKNREPKAAEKFFETSNARVLDLFRSTNWNDRRRAWEKCRLVGLKIGKTIRAPAELELPQGLGLTKIPRGVRREIFVKALGAGHETGLAVGPAEAFPSPLPSDCEPVRISPKGICFED